MKHYRYLFWDLDGTITNSYPGIRNCVNYALDHFGITIKEEDYRKFIGPPLRVSFPEVCGFDQETTEEAVRLYRERYVPVGLYETELFPGAKEALAALHAAGYRQYLTSSKPEPQCRELLGRLELADLFDDIVGASLDGRIDSKLSVLEETFRRLEKSDSSYAKKDTVLIGDTRFDAEGAMDAGIDFVGVGYGYGDREEMKALGALAVYDSLEEFCADLL